MSIIRIINKNRKLIGYIIITIVFALFVIKLSNSAYETNEQRKIQEANKSKNEIKIENEQEKENYYAIESNSIEKTMDSFVQFCNNKQIENAYKMLTQECKKAMFPTIEDFEKIYINNIYNVEREYKLIEWSTEGNKSVYQVTLYGNILATGNSNDLTQEYYTFIKENNGNYKLNINNYIYGEEKNIVNTINNITIKIGQVDVFEQYERVKITITNNTSKKICLTGDKYKKNIYLKNSKKTIYSSLNSEFDNEEIIINPNNTQTFTVNFNKTYSINSKAEYLVFSDVIMDYENYLKSEDKDNYSNRKIIEVKYKK